MKVYHCEKCGEKTNRTADETQEVIDSDQFFLLCKGCWDIVRVWVKAGKDVDLP